MGPPTHAAMLLLSSMLASTAPAAPAAELDDPALPAQPEPADADADAPADADADGPAHSSDPSAPDPSAPAPSVPPPGLDAEQPGIELAGPPLGPQPAPAPAPTREDSSYWPDPGTAPADGIGAFMGGAVLIPSAALMTLLLIEPPLEGDDEGEVSTLVAGIGLGTIGLGFLGMGISRQLKLRRWAAAYRVRPTYQGNGMLAAGGLALNYGLALGLAGALGGSVTEPEGIAMLCAGIGAAGLLAPPLLVFGKRARERYIRTGGWVRPPLPPIPVSPSVQVHRQGFSLGLGGRF